jgi:hypothetical protein
MPRTVSRNLMRNGSIILFLINTCLLIGVLASCSSGRNEQKEEQISISTSESSNEKDSSLNSIQGNISLNQIATSPNAVILTGLPNHRLVTVYKFKGEGNATGGNYSYSRYSKDYDENESEELQHFMPGIDILYGYNLLNIAHYDLKTEKLNFLFNHPALIKTLYYPSFIQDSLDKKPINRDYYLVSVYDEDTNKDTLINRKDLRRFYHFDASSSVKTQLIPSDYSVVRSQYDSPNDVMYLFARHDANKNGTGDKKEPIHIFWINLKAPLQAKRLY